MIFSALLERFLKNCSGWFIRPASVLAEIASFPVAEKSLSKKRIATFTLALSIFTVSACGYRVASKNRLDSRVQKVAVKPLENRTTTYEVEQILTRALIGEFVRRSDFEVMDEPGEADAVLEGTIRRLTVNPVTFGQSAFASTFSITVYARVAMTERTTGKVLFQNNNYIFRDQYVINVDVENFFSEANPALDRIAADFASSVVTSVLEYY